MDIIVRFNGIEVYGSEDMSIALKSVYSGQSVPVHVSRSGGDTVVDVQF
jgi:type II secretory pathway component PulC